MSSLSAISVCRVGEQVGVTVSNVDTLMPHPVSDCQGRKAHVNQQGDVAMPQIVYSDPLDPGLFRSPVHLTMEVGFCYREDTVCRLYGVQALDVVLHFITEESGHLNDPVALGRLGVSDNIPALDTLV